MIDDERMRREANLIATTKRRLPGFGKVCAGATISDFAVKSAGALVGSPAYAKLASSFSPRTSGFIASCVLLERTSFRPLSELVRLTNDLCLMCTHALLDFSIFSSIGHDPSQLFDPALQFSMKAVFRLCS